MDQTDTVGTHSDDPNHHKEGKHQMGVFHQTECKPASYHKAVTPTVHKGWTLHTGEGTAERLGATHWWEHLHLMWFLPHCTPCLRWVDKSSQKKRLHPRVCWYFCVQQLVLFHQMLGFLLVYNQNIAYTNCFSTDEVYALPKQVPAWPMASIAYSTW